MNQEVFAALGEALKRAEDVALVTIVATNGSTPQRVGREDAGLCRRPHVGTVGGGCYENDAFWKAKESLKTRKALRVKYELDDDFAQENGLVCGGQMEVFIEPIEPPPAGLHHRRRPRRLLPRRSSPTRPGSWCTWSTTARRSPTASASPTPPRSWSRTCPAWLTAAMLPGERLRGHRHARPPPRPRRAARVVQPRPALRRAHRQPRQGRPRLRGAGRPRASTPTVRHVHAPIGLDLGAVTPQEIAVSIVAELIAVRRGRAHDPAVAGASLKWMPKFERTPAGPLSSAARRGRANRPRDDPSAILRASSLGSRLLTTMTPGALSDRTRRVLACLVKDYIDTGEPVASATLSRRAGLGVSSATIRNVLAQLEDMGYVCQPHTSAGRVPTDLGYRYYVDMLLDDAPRRRATPPRSKPACANRPAKRRSSTTCCRAPRTCCSKCRTTSASRSRRRTCTRSSSASSSCRSAARACWW